MHIRPIIIYADIPFTLAYLPGETIRPALILYQDFEIPTKMRCSSRFHQLFTTISFIAFDFINYLILYTYFILTSHNTKLRTYLISHSQ